MRKPCADCTRKHLSQAIVLMGEANMGYPEHRWLAVGHLAEAEAEIEGRYKEIAENIRTERLAIMEGKKSNALMEIINRISSLNDNCCGESENKGGAMEIKTLKSSDFEKEVLQSKGKVVVMFYDGKNFPKCPHCDKARSILASKTVQATFFQLDVGADEDIGQQYGVTFFPTFIVFNDGKFFNRHTGSNNVGEIEKIINKEPISAPTAPSQGLPLLQQLYAQLGELVVKGIDIGVIQLPLQGRIGETLQAISKELQKRR